MASQVYRQNYFGEFRMVFKLKQDGFRIVGAGSQADIQADNQADNKADIWADIQVDSITKKSEIQLGLQ